MLRNEVSSVMLARPDVKTRVGGLVRCVSAVLDSWRQRQRIRPLGFAKGFGRVACVMLYLFA